MKAEFLTWLEVGLVAGSDGGRSLWELAQPLRYASAVLGEVLTVPSGFRTDFASVPRLPVVYLIMNDVGQPAAVVHDYLYRSGRVTRRQADSVLLEALRVLGVSWWRRNAMWAAVRIGGAGSYKG